MSTGKVCNPIARLILMKANDLHFHRSITHSLIDCEFKFSMQQFATSDNPAPNAHFAKQVTFALPFHLLNPSLRVHFTHLFNKGLPEYANPLL